MIQFDIMTSANISGTQETIVGYLGHDRYKLNAFRMSDEEIAAAVTDSSDDIALSHLTNPMLDTASRTDVAIHAFLTAFGYLPQATRGDSDHEAAAKLLRDDIVHKEIARLKDIKQLSDEHLLAYSLRLQAAMGAADSPIRATNIMRGLDKMTQHTAVDAFDHVATVIITTMVYADYASRSPELPTPQKLMQATSERKDDYYIHDVATNFEPEQCQTLLHILIPLIDNEVVTNTVFAIALDMKRAGEAWDDIVVAMSAIVARVEDER